VCLKPDLPKARGVGAQLSVQGLRSGCIPNTGGGHEQDIDKNTATKRKASPDELIKTSKKGEIELTEEQLDKAVGGIIVVCDQHKGS
jgi:hypothetical protein